MPELALVGYGKMGKLIEQLAGEYGFQVRLKLDEYNNANFEGLTAENFRGVDVAGGFFLPSAVATDVGRLLAVGVKLVVGTTGGAGGMEGGRAAAAAVGNTLGRGADFLVGRH